MSQPKIADGGNRSGVTRLPSGDEIVDHATRHVEVAGGDGLLFTLVFFEEFRKNSFKECLGATATQHAMAEFFPVPWPGGGFFPLPLLLEKRLLRRGIIRRK